MIRLPFQSRLLVPFGTKDWAVDRVSISTDEQGGPLFDCSVSHVVLEIKEQKALRLNSDWYRLYERPPVNELLTPLDRFRFIADHMPIYCDVWDKFQQIFLTKYFEFVARHVADNEAVLSDKLAGMSTLFSYEDWLLSAYLPLPQPIVYVPENPANETYADADMIRLPLLFWTGNEALILFFIGADTPSSRRINTREKLRAGGYTVLEIAQKNLMAEDQTWMDEFLLARFGNFWQSETLPSGPFKPAISDPLH